MPSLRCRIASLPRFAGEPAALLWGRQVVGHIEVAVLVNLIVKILHVFVVVSHVLRFPCVRFALGVEEENVMDMVPLVRVAPGSRAFPDDLVFEVAAS